MPVRSQLLQRESRDLQKAAPGLGTLTRLLDADDDGSIADDILSGPAKLFGRRGRATADR